MLTFFVLLLAMVEGVVPPLQPTDMGCLNQSLQMLAPHGLLFLVPVHHHQKLVVAQVRKSTTVPAFV